MAGPSAMQSAPPSTEKLLTSGQRVDVVTATKLAKACGKSQRWQAAVFVYDSLQSLRLADAILRGAVVSACASGSAWEAALELLKEGLDVIACSSAITACERGQQWERAISLLKEMRERRVQPNVITYNAAMSACEKGDSWQGAFSLFAEMIDLKISHSVVSYGAAIAACRKASDWERALDLVWMLEAPNRVIYSSAMEALLEAEHWQLALILWNQATEKKADAALISSAMSAWAQGGYWSEALNLLQELRDLSMVDGMAYTNAIRSCEASGHWELALILLDTAGRSGSGAVKAVPLVCSSCALAVLAAAAVWQQALELLGSHPKLQRDQVACGTALRACGRAGKWQEALALVQQAEKYDITGTILCNAAITACDTSAQWQRALALLQYMRNARVPEDSITICAAMGACEKGKQWLEALALLDEMKALNMQRNAVAFTAALTALGSKWQKAILLLEEMKHDAVTPNEVTYTNVIGACVSAMQWEASLWLQDEMGQNQMEPGVLALALGVAIQHGPHAAAFLEDLSEKGLARAEELRKNMAVSLESHCYLVAILDIHSFIAWFQKWCLLLQWIWSCLGCAKAHLYPKLSAWVGLEPWRCAILKEPFSSFFPRIWTQFQWLKIKNRYPTVWRT